MGYYTAEQRERNQEKRDLAYYSKVDEVIKKAYVRHQASACNNDEQVRNCREFTLELSQLIRLVTETCPAEFPLSRERLTLLNSLGRELGLFPLDEYVEVLGTMLYFGTLSDLGLRCYNQPPEIVEEALAIKNRMIANFGMGTAIYAKNPNKDERINAIMQAGVEIRTQNPLLNEVERLEELRMELQEAGRQLQQPDQQLQQPNQGQQAIDNEEEVPDVEVLFA